MRLIDADKIIVDGLENKSIEIRNKDFFGHDSKIVSILFHDIEELINSQPTVNALEVETAFEGCFVNCDHFEIEQERLYADGEIIHRIFRCSEIKRCRHLLKNIKVKENKHAD